MNRVLPWLGVGRFDAGRSFFGACYAFILAGWYPQLQDTYSEAYRGSSFAVDLAVISLVLGFLWGSGSLVDMLLVAASAALGCAAGFALGAALTAELAAVRPFYASELERSILEPRLWGEFIPSVLAAAAGGFAGALAATVVNPKGGRLGPGSGAIALLLVALAAAVTAGLGAISIDLVAGSVTAGSQGSRIDTWTIWSIVLLLGCLAAASAVLARRDADDGPTFRVTILRVAAGVTLVVVPVVVASVYRSFVLEPF